MDWTVLRRMLPRLGSKSSAGVSPRVSVVVAAYNHLDFVRDCIASVQAQSFPDWELVVTDDGSTDGTAAVLESLAAQDERLRLNLFPQNLGACVALNDAIARARGELLAVLNSDDRFLPDKLAIQVAFLDRHPDCAAVFAQPRFIDESGASFRDETHKDYTIFQVENRPRIEWLRYFWNHSNCLCHPTALVRRSVYRELGSYDPRLAQLPDFDMWVRLCTRFQLHVLPDTLVELRILSDGRNASAARPDVLAREPWERLQVLRHFKALSPPDFEAVFPPQGPYGDLPAGTPPWVRLARFALAIGGPAYKALALELLHDGLGTSCEPRPGVPSYPDYHRICGESDVFGQRAP